MAIVRQLSPHLLHNICIDGRPLHCRSIAITFFTNPPIQQLDAELDVLLGVAEALLEHRPVSLVFAQVLEATEQ